MWVAVGVSPNVIAHAWEETSARFPPGHSQGNRLLRIAFSLWSFSALSSSSPSSGTPRSKASGGATQRSAGIAESVLLIAEWYALCPKHVENGQTRSSNGCTRQEKCGAESKVSECSRDFSPTTAGADWRRRRNIISFCLKSVRYPHGSPPMEHLGSAVSMS
jgi:hypothetical protein